jgi:hypothetical protein
MNGRTIARVLLALIIIGGVTMLGVGAYNAGVTQGLMSSGQVVVTPGAYPVGPYVGGWGYGWGHGPGFGFFGFLGTLFFIFLIFALLRAAFGRGRGWGPGGWGGPDSGRYGRGPWEDRARAFHDELHRSKPDGTTRDGGGQPTA